MKNPRRMPTKKAIKTHWAKWLVYFEKFDSVDELFEADYCFACGMEEKTERAHILAKFKGGSDEVDNLHLLCPQCHKASEFMDGVDYNKWLLERNLLHRGLENSPASEIIKLIKLGR